MSSGFVSGGTIDNPVERDDEWLKAQKDLDAKRLREKEEKGHPGGKSLYEVLQANKAAKQEAFEESIKLKNQFRSLDEQEVEFLTSVLDKTRAQEAAVRKETSEQLDQFRKQQEQAQKAELTEESNRSPIPEEEQWTSGPRKRKREKEAIPGVKLRKSSSGSQDKTRSSLKQSTDGRPGNGAPQISGSSRRPGAAKEIKDETTSSSLEASSTGPAHPADISEEQNRIPASPSRPPGTGLGLGNYSSDEDD